jgi:hypothetical protein
LSFHGWKETTKGEVRDNWSKVHVFTMGKPDLSALRQIITLNNWLGSMVWSTTWPYLVYCRSKSIQNQKVFQGVSLANKFILSLF